MKKILHINRERLMQRIYTLGTKGGLPGGGCCRLALTQADKEGRDLVVSWMKESGLTVHIDQLGNVVGIRAGQEEGAPVMMGSHIDTVATGGFYDGNVGVLAGLEVINTLNDENITTRYPVAVAFFTNEEGARFAPDMMGSLVFQGDLPLDIALDTVGIDGTTVKENLEKIGYAGTAPVGKSPLHPRAYVELHVEQGPVLEEEGFCIGVVEKVQGISWTEFEITGQSNHAGTTPIRLRKDPALVTARIACFMRDMAKEMGGDQVATTGVIELAPGLINVVPQSARMTVDLRNTDEILLQQAEKAVFAYADKVAREEGVSINRRTLARFEPVPFHATLVDLVEATAREFGLSNMRMPSGAGHDAQIMARICPAAMIFVPSEKGISHNIQEFTKPEDIEAGANVLANVIVKLANS